MNNGIDGAVQKCRDCFSGNRPDVISSAVVLCRQFNHRRRIDHGVLLARRVPEGVVSLHPSKVRYQGLAIDERPVQPNGMQKENMSLESYRVPQEKGAQDSPK